MNINPNMLENAGLMLTGESTEITIKHTGIAKVKSGITAWAMSVLES